MLQLRIPALSTSLEARVAGGFSRPEEEEVLYPLIL